MEWLAIIKGFLALPGYIKEIIGYLKKAEEAGWFNKTAQDFRPLLSGPTTKEQKDEAAKAIANDISKL